MRILISAQTTSTHVVRWVEQLKGTGWDVHVVQAVAKNYGLSLRVNATLHVPFKCMAPAGMPVELSLPDEPDFQDAPIRTDRWTVEEFHYRYLSSLIDRLQPDVIHSLGLHVNDHNNCLPMLAARRYMKSRFKAPWVYSSWGTDLDYYARAADTSHEVRETLAACDYHIAECDRDRRLAVDLGFQGEFAGFLPAFGGVPYEQWSGFRAPGPTSARRGILLKGRDHTDGDPIGRAMTAMRAFGQAASALAGQPIRIVQGGRNVAGAAEWLRAERELDIQVERHLTFEELLTAIGHARVGMAVTTHDGLPSFLVEIMALGAFVIHSAVESVKEWITHGENGLLVDPTDPTDVARAIERAMTDDRLVDRAAEINDALVREKLTYSLVQQRTIETYERVAARGPTLPREP